MRRNQSVTFDTTEMLPTTPDPTPGSERGSVLRSLPVIAAVGAIALLAALAAGAAATDVAFGHLTRDPVAVANLEAYVGALSHVGVMLWSTTGAIAMFGAAVVWFAGSDLEPAHMLGYMGLVTIALTIDDALLVHDRIVPRLTPLPELSVLAVYGIATVYGLYRFRSLISRQHYAWLITAMVCFAASVGIDLLPQDDASGVHFFFEDGFKFLGIVGWMIFFVGATWSAVTDIVGPTAPTESDDGPTDASA